MPDPDPPPPPPPPDITAAKEALKTALAVALPGRVVTRSFRQIPQRTREDLLAGVVSVVGLGEDDFANYRGREADLGKLQVVVIGQIEVDSDDPRVLEDAEDRLADDIKQFLRGDFPPPIRACLATGFRQSGQQTPPHGWVVFEMEVRT